MTARREAAALGAVGRSVAAPRRRRKAARPGAVRGRHRGAADGARQGAALPVRRTRGSSPSTRRRPSAMPGVVVRPHRGDLGDIDPYWGHAIKDRPVVAVDRVRFAGEPVAAVAAEDEATAPAALERIHVEYEELPVVGTVEQALARGRADGPRGPVAPGLFHGLGELKPARGQRLLPLPASTAARSRRSSPHAEHVVEGEYTFPAVYQYAMETHTVVAQVEGDEITLWASCQHPFLVRAEIAALFQVPIGNVRIVVPYLGGGFGSKSYTKMEPVTVALARKARPTGAHPEPRRRVDGDDAPPRDARSHADGDERRGTAARAEGRVLVRHRCLRRQRASCDRHGGRRCARAVPLGCVPRRRSLRLYEHRSRGVVPRLRRRAPAVDRRAAGGRTRAPCRSRPARGSAPEPLCPGRGAPRGRQAARCGPRRGRRARRRGDRLERRAKRRARGRGLSVGLLAAGAHPVSSADRPHGGRRQRGRPRRHNRGRPGSAHGLRPDRGRGAAAAPRARHGARRRHALHPLRPLDGRQPLDDDRRPRRQARSRAGARASSSGSPAPRTSSPTPTPSSSSATSGLPAAS